MLATMQFIIFCLPGCCLKAKRIKYNFTCCFVLSEWGCLTRGLRIFGPQGDKVMGGWRKLCNISASQFVLCIKYYQDHKIKEDEIGRACCTYVWELRNVNKILVIKPVGKRLLARLRHRWEVNITSWEGYTAWSTLKFQRSSLCHITVHGNQRNNTKVVSKITVL